MASRWQCPPAKPPWNFSCNSSGNTQYGNSSWTNCGEPLMKITPKPNSLNLVSLLSRTGGDDVQILGGCGHNTMWSALSYPFLLDLQKPIIPINLLSGSILSAVTVLWWITLNLSLLIIIIIIIIIIDNNNNNNNKKCRYSLGSINTTILIHTGKHISMLVTCLLIFSHYNVLREPLYTL